VVEVVEHIIKPLHALVAVQVVVEMVELLLIRELEREPQIKDLMVVRDMNKIELVEVEVQEVLVTPQHPQLMVRVELVYQVQ
jgi:hypothetical protein